MKDPIIEGETDRISGSGNAMWAVCIALSIKMDQCLSDFVSATGISRRKMIQSIENTNHPLAIISTIFLPDLRRDLLSELQLRFKL